MFTRSSRHYRGITTSFYSICIVLGTVCVNPLSAVPEFTVSGHVGSTAVLPCKLESEDTGTLYIKWQIGSKTVFERHGEETYQGEGYKGRVDVPEEELRKGNCSLVLRNLKPTDAAVYRSFLVVRRTKRSVTRKTVALSHVDLSVHVPEFTVSGHVGSTAVLPCELQSKDTGTPYITWQFGSETVFERHGEETYQGEGYKGRVDVPEEELRKGNCSLVLRNLEPTDTAVYRSSQIVRHTNRSVTTKTVALSHVDLSVHENLNKENKSENEVPRDGDWTGVGVGVVGTIAVIAVIVAVLYWYKRRRNQNHRNADPPQTNSPLNTQLNPANPSQDENPNDQGEHLLQNSSQDDHGEYQMETLIHKMLPESAF
ncbi:hypothetical protein AMELA_G00164350 [Ameiurus melas]|uniref:Uncharacterized protein n=1 Tax=Ameiurus melas TaxID=219545 RepID=A0A7J6AFX9_AMEME|nr:hypothetical protein AMELA_G00164350 [Ameiurus melas]